MLGAGLNLGWLAAPWLQERTVAYWGDLDTWGLHMLAIARGHVPHLHALLMDRATFTPTSTWRGRTGAPRARHAA